MLRSQDVCLHCHTIQIPRPAPPTVELPPTAQPLPCFDTFGSVSNLLRLLLFRIFKLQLFAPVITVPRSPKFQHTHHNSSALHKMDHPTANQSNSGTVPVHYIVVCGNPLSDSEAEKFVYSEQAPAPLCEPHGASKPAPDADETGKFIASVVDRHHLEILKIKAWCCISCNQPAKELLHSAIPFLSPGPTATPDFKPTIWDTAAPICRSGGSCDRLAEELVHKFAKDGLPMHIFELTSTCDRCGKKTDVKLCGGCKTLG